MGLPVGLPDLDGLRSPSSSHDDLLRPLEAGLKLLGLHTRVCAVRVAGHSFQRAPRPPQALGHPLMRPRLDQGIRVPQYVLACVPVEAEEEATPPSFSQLAALVVPRAFRGELVEALLPKLQ